MIHWDNKIIKATWGICDHASAQGWLYKRNGPYWEFYWCGIENTLIENDGKMMWNDNAWRSENSRIISCPFAVVDDFGDLVPVFADPYEYCRPVIY